MCHMTWRPDLLFCNMEDGIVWYTRVQRPTWHSIGHFGDEDDIIVESIALIVHSEGAAAAAENANIPPGWSSIFATETWSTRHSVAITTTIRKIYRCSIWGWKLARLTNYLHSSSAQLTETETIQYSARQWCTNAKQEWKCNSRRLIGSVQSGRCYSPSTRVNLQQAASVSTCWDRCSFFKTRSVIQCHELVANPHQLLKILVKNLGFQPERLMESGQLQLN